MSGATPWKVSMGESEETAEALAQYGIVGHSALPETPGGVADEQADIGRLCIVRFSPSSECRCVVLTSSPLHWATSSKRSLLAAPFNLSVRITVERNGPLTLQTYHYFYQPRRDTRLARLGVMWIAAIVVIHLGLCTYQNISLIKFSDQYARRLYIDWVRPTIVALEFA